MRRDTIFDLASLTKPIATTTAIMMLVDEGSIDLDDPVAKTLPSFADRGKEAVTIRHLLSHSAGPEALARLPRAADPEGAQDRRAADRDARRARVDPRPRAARGLVHEPGEAAVYGDLDFIVLGALVEEVSKQPFDEFCESRIFTRLGLMDTRFFPMPVDGSTGALPDAVRRRVAATENCPWRERIIWGEVHDPNASAMGGVAGHAGLFSTARRRDALRAGLPRRLARAERVAAARAGARVLRAADICPRPRTGRSVGIRRPRALVVGPALLGEFGRPPRLHGHVALDRSRARG